MIELDAWGSHERRFRHEQRVDLELRGLPAAFTFKEYAGLTEVVVADLRAA